MKVIKMILAFALGMALLVLFVASAPAQTCATPTTVSKTFAASTVSTGTANGGTSSELSGDVTAGCTKTYLMPNYNCGGCQAPTNGTITSFNANTGAFVYRPNTGFIGTDSFTFIVRATGSNTADSAQTAINVSVTNALTTVTAKLTDLGFNAVSGKVVLILAQVTDSPGGSLIPRTRGVTATLDGQGRFTTAVYPSVGLSPYSIYNLVYTNTTTGQQEIVGQYEIPASIGTVDLGTCNCRIIEAASQARLTLATRASVDALLAQARTWEVQDNGVSVGQASVLNIVPGSGMTSSVAIGSGIANVTINCATCSGGSLASSTGGRPAYYSSNTVVGGFAFSGAHKLWTSNAAGNGMEWKSVACSAGITCTSTSGQLAIVGPGASFTLNTQTGTTQTLGISNTGASAPTWNSAGNVHTLILPFAGASNSWGGVSNVYQAVDGRKEFLAGITVKNPGTLLLNNSGGTTIGTLSDAGIQHVKAAFGTAALGGDYASVYVTANPDTNATSGHNLLTNRFNLTNNAYSAGSYSTQVNNLTIASSNNAAHTQPQYAQWNEIYASSTSGGTVQQLVATNAFVYADRQNVPDSVAYRGTGYLDQGNVTTHTDFLAEDFTDLGTGALTTHKAFGVKYLATGTNRYAFHTDQGPGGEAAALISHGGGLELRGVTLANRPSTAGSNNGRLVFNSSVNRFQISSSTGSWYDLERNRFAQNCTGTCALDFAAGQTLEVTLTGNVTTVTVANIRDGEHYSVFWKQNGTGTRTIASLGSNIKVGPGGWTSGTNTTTANAVDLMLCSASGSNLYCSYTTDVKQ